MKCCPYRPRSTSHPRNASQHLHHHQIMKHLPLLGLPLTVSSLHISILCQTHFFQLHCGTLTKNKFSCPEITLNSPKADFYFFKCCPFHYDMHIGITHFLIIYYPFVIIHKFVFVNTFRKSYPEENTLAANRSAGGGKAHETIHHILCCPSKKGL